MAFGEHEVERVVKSLGRQWVLFSRTETFRCGRLCGRIRLPKEKLRQALELENGALLLPLRRSLAPISGAFSPSVDRVIKNYRYSVGHGWRYVTIR